MKFKPTHFLFPSLRSLYIKVSFLAASLLFVLFFLTFQLADRPTSVPAPTLPPFSFLSFLESNRNNFRTLASQEILLTDTEPLFLPTPFNSTSLLSHTLPLTRNINYFSIRPEIHHLNTEILHSLFNSFLPTIHTPTEAFDLSLSNFAETFGPKSHHPLLSTPSHPLYLQVFPLNHPGEPISFNIHADLAFKRDILFNPCEFYILIYNHSIIGDVRMITASGHEDLDDQLRNFILSYPELTHLQDGYYKLAVGN